MPDQKKEPTSPTGSIASTMSIGGGASEAFGGEDPVKHPVRVTRDTVEPTKGVLEMSPEAVAKHLDSYLKTTRYEKGSDAKFSITPIAAQAILKLAASGDDLSDLSTAEANRMSLLNKVREYRRKNPFAESKGYKHDPLIGLLTSAILSVRENAKDVVETANKSGSGQPRESRPSKP